MTKPLGISVTGFLQAECRSCHPTNSVNALKKTQIIDPHHWPGFILSSSTTGLLLREGWGPPMPAPTFNKWSK